MTRQTTEGGGISCEAERTHVIAWFKVATAANHLSTTLSKIRRDVEKFKIFGL